MAITELLPYVDAALMTGSDDYDDDVLARIVAYKTKQALATSCPNKPSMHPWLLRCFRRQGAGRAAASHRF